MSEDETIFYNTKLGTLHANEITREIGSDNITASGILSDGHRVKWTFPLRNVEEIGVIYFVDGKITVHNV